MKANYGFLLLVLGASLLTVACGDTRGVQDRERSRPLLNSERIEQKFGSYGIDVLKNSPAIRVSNLYSLHDGRKICRTFAAVNYPALVDPQYVGEHEQIVGGQSMGAVFVRNGWVVEKRHRYFGTLPMTEGLSRLMGGASAEHVAVHIYVLAIEKAGFSFEYASIAEIHHPGYLGLEDLRDIYGDLVDELSIPDDLDRSLLELAIEETRTHLIIPHARITASRLDFDSLAHLVPGERKNAFRAGFGHC